MSRNAAAVGLIVGGVFSWSEHASGQSSAPAVFVANNGNCEGSVSSFTINPDGSLNFVQKLITGSVPCGSGQTAPGLNAQCIDLSPNGQWLVTGHGTISGTIEQITFYQVHTDATFSIKLVTTTPDSPVTVRWLSDEYLAVTAHPLGQNDFVIIYKFDPVANSLTQHFYQPVPYIFEIIVDRENDLMYTRAGTSGMQPFRINADYTITKLTANPIATGMFFLNGNISPGGARLYFGGGISAGDHAVGSVDIDVATGNVALTPGMPFPSSGDSPKEVDVSSDGQFAFVNHGGDGDIISFSIDPKTGVLSEIPGAVYEVGDQGDSGNMTIMGDRLFVTRRYSSSEHGPSGLVSLTINPDGTLTEADDQTTNGSLPWDNVAWPGNVIPCPTDLTGNQMVDVDDLLAVINGWGACGLKCPADVAPPGGNGFVDVDDLLAVINTWGPCQ